MPGSSRGEDRACADCGRGRCPGAPARRTRLGGEPGARGRRRRGELPEHRRDRLRRRRAGERQRPGRRHAARTPPSRRPARGTPTCSTGSSTTSRSSGNTGTDSFTYTVSDGQGNTATGTVTATLWVDPPSSPGGVSISGPDAGSATVTWTASGARRLATGSTGTGVLVAGTSGPHLHRQRRCLRPVRYRFDDHGPQRRGLRGAAVRPRATGSAQLLTPTGLAVDVTDDPTSLLADLDRRRRSSGPWNVYRDGATAHQQHDPTPSRTPAWSPDASTATRCSSPSPRTSIAVYPREPPVRRSSGALPSSSAPSTDSSGTSAGTTGDPGSGHRPRARHPGRTPAGPRQSGLILQQDGARLRMAVTRPLIRSPTSARVAPAGDLGFPVSAERGDRAAGRRTAARLFEGGSIWSSAFTARPRAVRLGHRGRLGGERLGGGPAGLPGRRSWWTLPGGVWQAFEDGAVYWSAATGSHGVSGPIGEPLQVDRRTGRRPALPHHRRELRNPRRRLLPGLFQGGALHPLVRRHRGCAASSAPIRGDLDTPYAAAERRPWLPHHRRDLRTAPAAAAPRRFQGGSHLLVPRHRRLSHLRGACTTPGPALGFENGTLGYPTQRHHTCGLQRRRLLPDDTKTAPSSPHPPPAPKSACPGPLRDRLGRAPASRTAPWATPPSAINCGLQRRRLLPDDTKTAPSSPPPATGAQVSLSGSHRDSLGSAPASKNGTLGHPHTSAINADTIKDGGCYQMIPKRRHHLLTRHRRPSQPSTAPSAPPGPAPASENGTLGYPISDEKFVTGSYQQTFQGGWITIRPSGTTVVYR